jgi:hypothetical protein
MDWARQAAVVFRSGVTTAANFARSVERSLRLAAFRRCPPIILDTPRHEFFGFLIVD